MFELLLAISILLSYISIYQPLVFSRNITPIYDTGAKIWTLICVLTVSFLWTWYGIFVTEYPLIMLCIHLVLIQIALIDSYSKIIPNRLLLVLLILFMINVLEGSPSMYWIFLLLFNCTLLTTQVIIKQLSIKNLMGWGDIKLLMILSLIFQKGVLVILLGGVILAGLYSIILIVKNRENKKKRVPLGPFFTVIILLLSEIIEKIEVLLLIAV